MSLKSLLKENRQEILKAWFQNIVDTYPEDSRKYIARSKNQFGNPVGFTINKEIEGVFDELIQGIDEEKVSGYLENIIKIRAVQSFDAGEAVQFIFLLKKSIQGALRKELKDIKIISEFIELLAEIDKLALISFNIHTASRERLYELRTREVTRGTERLLQRAGILYNQDERRSISEEEN